MLQTRRSSRRGSESDNQRERRLQQAVEPAFKDGRQVEEVNRQGTAAEKKAPTKQGHKRPGHLGAEDRATRGPQTFDARGENTPQTP